MCVCVRVTLSICAHTPLQYRRNTTSSHPAVKEMQYFDGKISLVWMSDISIMIAFIMYMILVQGISQQI